jgi:hypothetical protein
MIVYSFVLYLFVLVQGGFFQRVYLPGTVILAVLCVFLLFKQKGVTAAIPVQPLVILAALEFCYLVSAVSNDSWEKNSSRMVFVFLIGVLYLLHYVMTPEQKIRIVQSLFYLGILEGMIGVLAYLDCPLPLQSIVRNHRFMGTFQYANATALFLDMVLLLQFFQCLFEKKKPNGRFFLLIWLILTFSAGGIAVYTGGMLFLTILYLRQENGGSKNTLQKEILFGECFFLAIAGGYALAIYGAAFLFNSHWGVCLIFLSVLFLEVFWERIRLGRHPARNLVYPAVILEIAAGWKLFGGRIMGTGMERLKQMRDAFCLLRKHILSGIGVGGWQEYISQNQAISYKASLVHNSILQVGVESGIAAMILLIVLFVFLIFQKRKNPLAISVLSMVFVHFCVDITLFFSGIIITAFVCMMVSYVRKSNILPNFPQSAISKDGIP